MAARGTPTPSGSEDDPIYFASSPDLRRWMERNHSRRDEVWVGFHRKATGVPSVTWPEVVDVALCFGWIDGIRKTVDGTRYKNRLTPRRRGSNWSLKNINRMRELIAEGLVTPEGLAAFEARRDDRSGVYSFEQEAPAALPTAMEAELRANQAAAAFFDSQPPGYQRRAIHWVLDARREETRQRRLRTLISDSESGLRIALLRGAPRGQQPL